MQRTWTSAWMRDQHDHGWHDQSKFSLPRPPLMKAKAFDTFQRPRLHVAALLCHGHFVLMSVADPGLKKDSNTCTEMLAHALQLLHDKGINLADCKLTLQADNTCCEVKNAMPLQFLTAQVFCGRLHSAALSFLSPHGTPKMPPR